MNQSSLKTPLITVLFIFLSLFFYIKVAGPLPLSVNSVITAKNNLFSVQGTGKATAIPDTALISLGITKTATSITEAQNQTNRIANKILDDLKKLGIEDKNIKTTNYSVYPNYDYTSRGQKPNGYTVTENIEVKIKPIEKVNQAIDSTTADGANIVGGVSFVLDDAVKKDIEEKARKEAVANAKEKAESLSNAAGIRLGKIIDVQESSAGVPVLLRTMAVGGDTEQKSDTNITPGENTVEITVTLSYETY